MNMSSKLLAVVALPMAVFLTGCKDKHDPSEERKAYLALEKAVLDAGSEHNCMDAYHAWNTAVGSKKRTTSKDARMTSTKNLKALPLESLNRNELRNLAVAQLKDCFAQHGQDKVKFAPAPYGSLQIYIGGMKPISKNLLHRDPQGHAQEVGEEEDASEDGGDGGVRGGE
jgi:hypothetical protein